MSESVFAKNGNTYIITGKKAKRVKTKALPVLPKWEERLNRKLYNEANNLIKTIYSNI
jgi:hypothetical protein